MNRIAGILFITLVIVTAGCASSPHVPQAPARPDARYTDGNLVAAYASRGWEYSFRRQKPAVHDCNVHGTLLFNTPDEGVDAESYRRAAHYVLACLQANKHGRASEEAERRATLIANTPAQRLPSALRKPPFMSTDIMLDRVHEQLAILEQQNARLLAATEDAAKAREADRRRQQQQQQEIERQRRLIETLKEKLRGFEIFEGEGARILQLPISETTQ